MDPLSWTKGRVRFLDQTRLPAETVFTETDDPDIVIDAIRRLAVRGAPLIGIAGAYACVLAAKRHVDQEWASVEPHWSRIAEARPTAVNLSSAVARIRHAVRDHSDTVSLSDIHRMDAEAAVLVAAERSACDRIAEFGAALLPQRVSVLTHCNTGALATGGRGTAFGIIRSLWEAGRLEHLYIDETRPLFQGSRLTAWEAAQFGIPSTLITDSTAASLMRTGRIQAVIVGADRIARNGDVANKIGTYGLAVVSRAHGVKFFVAGPMTTIDASIQKGDDIVVEERHPDEILVVGGGRVAPPGIQAYAPAFDITPAALIDALVTDRGVVRPPLGEGLSGILGTVPAV